ncbi:MAG: APC family permease, partial [Chloroflexi bacterium]|nr:APC family permease [Chloroflexota bacterium]
ALIMIANLRGIRTAGILFSLPIYGYTFGSAAVIVYGLTRWAGGSLPPYTPPPAAQDLLGQPAAALGLLLILRAFSSGAVALTGIEAVSNGVPYYKEPEVQNAHRWLVALAISFGALFIGISFLAARIGIVPDPTETETLHSQLTRTLVGTGPAHTLLQVCALLLLIVAADTGFADFPRLLSLLARDGYLPHAFAERGARLAFSNGVVAVAVISAVLIVLPVLILTFRSLGLHHERLAQRVSVASSADGQTCCPRRCRTTGSSPLSRSTTSCSRPSHTRAGPAGTSKQSIARMTRRRPRSCALVGTRSTAVFR